MAWTMMDTILSVRETLLKELLRNKEISQSTFDKYTKKSGQPTINYDTLSPTSKFILQLINYSSASEALKYLNSLPEEELYEWGDIFATLQVENKNKTYETILGFFKDRNSGFGDFVWFSNQWS